MTDLSSIIGSLSDLSRDEIFALREAIDDRLRTEPPNGELTPEEWVKDFRDWAESHRPLPHPADDSRDSIYEGRGE
jgi:hypothetical protein